MPKPLDTDLRAAILADIRAGKLSRGAIARKHGVSAWSVGNIAKQANVTDAFSREQTKTATQARAADTEAVLTEQLAGMAQDIALIRARAWGPYEQALGGREGVEIVTLKLPPLRDVQAAYTSIGIILDKIWKRQAMATGGNAEDLRKSLVELGAALGLTPEAEQ